MAQDDDPVDEVQAIAMTGGAALARAGEAAARNAQNRQEAVARYNAGRREPGPRQAQPDNRRNEQRRPEPDSQHGQEHRTDQRAQQQEGTAGQHRHPQPRPGRDDPMTDAQRDALVRSGLAEDKLPATKVEASQMIGELHAGQPAEFKAARRTADQMLGRPTGEAAAAGTSQTVRPRAQRTRPSQQRQRGQER